MNTPQREKDIIDFVEAFAAQSGHVEAVDESYYRSFIGLTQREVEKLALAVLLDQEPEVRRLANGQTDSSAVAAISDLVDNVFSAIAIGLARFDAFGRLGFVARVGEEPTPEIDKALEHRHTVNAPIIENTVRRTLPWLLSREPAQGELPL